jgi:uncharacterized membrane protein YeiB
VMGYYYAKYETSFEKIYVAKYLTIGLFPIMLLFFEKKHYIYTSGIFGGEYSVTEYIAINGYRWLIGLIGSIFVITIIQLLQLSSRLKHLMKIVASLGRRSLQIYVLSVVVLSAYLPKGLEIIKQIPIAEDVYQSCTANMEIFYLLTFLVAVLYSGILYWIIEKVGKYKIAKFIFGR